MGQFVQRTPSDASSIAMRSASHFSVTPNEKPTDSPPDVQIAKSEDGHVRKRGKGHTKSRTGCFNCKRARIKCKENRPSCDYCAHRGLRCEWPEVQITQVGALIRKPTPETSILANPQTPSPVFTIQDFRLFNHFIQTAYPHHPIGNDDIWTHEIPIISSDYDFLLHAMLALGASDLASSTDTQELSVTAMNHRVKSIEALNGSIAGGLKCREQANAMLATCFVLLFQSVLINDGLAEYMAFLRGVIAVGMQMAEKRLKPLFVKIFGDEQLEMIEPSLQTAPLIDAELVRGACRSLEKIVPLCQTQVEAGACGVLLSMARNLITSSRDAYMELRTFYETLMMMPYEVFRDFTNPANKVGQLLQAHFVAMQLIMSPIMKGEWAGRKSATSGGANGKSGRWLETLHKNIPADMLKYYEWTLWVEKEVYYGTLLDGVFNTD